MPDVTAIIESNVAETRARIERAAVRSGRSATDVTLVGVTKYVDADVTRMLAETGVVDLGESRPQDLIKKVASLSGNEDIRWHMIGHLQRNKARKIISHVSLIHSVDNLRLLLFLDRLAEELDLPNVHILLEVNVTADESKHGFSAEALDDALQQAQQAKRVQIDGLMAMAGRTASESEIRRQFKQVRELRDRLAANTTPNAPLTELSMGMSGDFEIAIEEGATLVRVGSGLFSGIPR